MERREIVVKPLEITPEMCNLYFVNYHFGKGISPAPPIALIFLELLEKDKNSLPTVAQIFENVPGQYPSEPFIFLPSSESNLSKLTLSPKEILWYFFQNIENHASRNFFIINNQKTTQPLYPNRDLKIVDIHFLKTVDGINKYFIYVYLYVQWRNLGTTISNKSLNFVFHRI
ncbi:MAG: hypothetical protein WCG45_02055 [bacterium]